jgi:hypothetical protein
MKTMPLHSQSFQIKLSAPTVPMVWKTHWNLLAGHVIYPELRFESLLCLSLEPDFVLDFGWSMKPEGITYALQINRGHFGLSDVVYFGAFLRRDEAFTCLQDWLDRMAADEATQLADADLQSRLLAIDQKLRCYFVPPAGDSIEEVLSSHVRKLILRKSPEFWLQGSRDAALQFKNRQGQILSQLIFLQRPSLGFYLEYHAGDGPVLHNISHIKAKMQEPDVTITLGGAPWDLPANRFVSAHVTALITSEFIDSGTGGLPQRGRWRA